MILKYFFFRSNSCVLFGKSGNNSSDFAITVTLISEMSMPVCTMNSCYNVKCNFSSQQMFHDLLLNNRKLVIRFIRSCLVKSIFIPRHQYIEYRYQSCRIEWVRMTMRTLFTSPINKTKIFFFFFQMNCNIFSRIWNNKRLIITKDFFKLHHQNEIFKRKPQCMIDKIK